MLYLCVPQMEFQTRIYNNGRKWLLRIPSIIMKGLGWSEDVVNLEIDPEKNSIRVMNVLTQPVGFFTFVENIKNAKYERNIKKLQKVTNQNLSEDGRKVLYDTNWDEIEDGGYYQVQSYLNLSRFFEKKSKKSENANFKEIEKNLATNYKMYAMAQKGYIEKKGGKKPAWFLSVEKKMNKEKVK